MDESQKSKSLDEILKESKRYNRSSIFFAVLVIVIASIYMFAKGGGSIVSQVSEDMLGVASGRDSVFVELKDITSVELIKELDVGTHISGEETETTYTGTYENDSYDTYNLYAYTKTGEYIVVHHKDGVLVFNAMDRKSTESIYEDLTQAIPQK